MFNINISNTLAVASLVIFQLSKEESFNLTKFVTNIKIHSGRLESLYFKFNINFRIEQRALYKSYPPLHHFTYFNFNGRL